MYTVCERCDGGVTCSTCMSIHVKCISKTHKCIVITGIRLDSWPWHICACTIQHTVYNICSGLTSRLCSTDTLKFRSGIVKTLPTKCRRST